MSNQMTDQSETKEYVVKIRDAFLCIIIWEVAWYASLVLKNFAIWTATFVDRYFQVLVIWSYVVHNIRVLEQIVRITGFY